MPRLFQDTAFDAIYDTTLAFHGRRQGLRPVALTVTCCVIEDSCDAASDANAPTAGRAFSITFPRSAWQDETPPQIGEWILLREDAGEMWLKADAITHMPDGDFVIAASWKPKRRPS